MDTLEHLTPEQKKIVISLPYRAGLWISQSDATGGEDADQKELTALSNIIHGFSAQVFGSELLQYIMNETVTRKDEWESWAAQVDSVPEDCRKAVDILHSYVDEKDVNAYSTRLMEIGEAVALAFREDEEPSQMKEMQLFISYFMLKLKAQLKKQPIKSFEQFLSISAKERAALGMLADALGTSYRI